MEAVMDEREFELLDILEKITFQPLASTLFGRIDFNLLIDLIDFHSP